LINNHHELLQDFISHGIINDPISNENYIQDLVRQGYKIRACSDSDTKAARTGDYTKFEKAKASGEQVISTDYYSLS
jgi:hypothetical protein